MQRQKYDMQTHVHFIVVGDINLLLLCNAQYFYIVDIDMYFNNKHRMYWCVSEHATMFHYTYIACVVVNNVLQRHMSSCFKCIVADNLSQRNSFILKYVLIAEIVKNTSCYILDANMYYCTRMGPHWPFHELHISTYFNNQLNAQFLYSITICMLHYNPRRVSCINMPIFRRTNCIITASGIVTLCKWLYSKPA